MNMKNFYRFKGTLFLILEGNWGIEDYKVLLILFAIISNNRSNIFMIWYEKCMNKVELGIETLYDLFLHRAAFSFEENFGYSLDNLDSI